MIGPTTSAPQMSYESLVIATPRISRYSVPPTIARRVGQSVTRTAVPPTPTAHEREAPPDHSDHPGATAGAPSTGFGRHRVSLAAHDRRPRDLVRPPEPRHRSERGPDVRVGRRSEGRRRCSTGSIWNISGGPYLAIAHDGSGARRRRRCDVCSLPNTVPGRWVDAHGHPVVRHVDAARTIAGRGLFVRLAEVVYEGAAADGVAGVYGFPNDASVSGFSKRLSWTIMDPLPMMARPIGLRYPRVRVGARRPMYAEEATSSGPPASARRHRRVVRRDRRAGIRRTAARPPVLGLASRPAGRPVPSALRQGRKRAARGARHLRTHDQARLRPGIRDGVDAPAREPGGRSTRGSGDGRGTAPPRRRHGAGLGATRHRLTIAR